MDNGHGQMARLQQRKLTQRRGFMCKKECNRTKRFFLFNKTESNAPKKTLEGALDEKRRQRNKNIFKMYVCNVFIYIYFSSHNCYNQQIYSIFTIN